VLESVKIVYAKLFQFDKIVIIGLYHFSILKIGEIYHGNFCLISTDKQKYQNTKACDKTCQYANQLYRFVLHFLIFYLKKWLQK
jgi:hypothetical protein